MLFDIKRSDIVDIIFPATSCSKSEVEAIKNYVQNQLNLTPRIELEKDLILNEESLKNEFPRNDAAFRFNQLKKAIKNDDSKIIWCARGGYCSGDLLPFLERENIDLDGKILIGFSDIVSLTSYFKSPTLCAPVLIQLASKNIEQSSEQSLIDLLFNKSKSLTYDLKSLGYKKDVESEIVGGCISVLVGHFGGKYQINFANKILFLEDEGESGERLDRYFRQIIELILKTNQKPQAILLGNFLQANTHGTPKEKNIKIAIERFLQKIEDFSFEIPVYQNDNLGHSNKMLPLILGKKVAISNCRLIQK